MKLFWGTYSKSENGVAAVEFSMIAPILILMMIGLMDLGLYVREKMKLEQISRAAVDYVMQGGQEENISEDIVTYYDSEHAGDYTVTTERVCTCSDGVAQSCDAVSCDFGDYSRQYFQVNVARTYETSFPYPGIRNEIDMSGFARMRLD